MGMEESVKLASISAGRQSKVVRLIEEYNLQRLGKELERLWTAEEDKQSYGTWLGISIGNPSACP